MFISFSGGSTSAYMAKRLKDQFAAEYDMVFGFANTGQENEETLVFADRCDREWGLGLVWLEAVVNPGAGNGTTHKVVSFASAARNGEPFEEVIKKYGIPNKAYPHCTRELKLRPMRSYLNSIGWRTGSYISAVGIRADEPRRLRADAAKEHIIYPLAHMFPTDKPAINDWWEDQPFRLNLADYRGNCRACWKKSTTKLVRIAKETPEAFDFPKRMESQYGFSGAGTNTRPRVFFRGNTSADSLIQIADMSTPPPTPTSADEDAGCSESCEAWT